MSSSSASSAAASTKPPRHSFCAQFVALLRRNAIMKRRQLCQTIATIALPFAVMLLMVLLRSVSSREEVPAQHYDRLRYSLDTDATLTALSAKLQARGHLLGLAPDTSFVRSIKTDLVTKYNMTDESIRVFKSGSAFEDHVKSSDYPDDDTHQQMEAAVVFDDMGPSSFTYQIRMNQSDNRRDSDNFPQQVPETFAPSTRDLSTGYSGQWLFYANSGFLALQDYIDNFVLQYKSAVVSPTLLTFQPFPEPSHTEDTFIEAIKGFVGILMTLAFWYPVSLMTKLMIAEKELKLKEVMKIMGMRGGALVLAWFVTYTILFFVLAVLVTLVTADNVFKESDGIIIFFVFWIFGIASFCFCFMMQSLFSVSGRGGTFAALAWFLSYFGSLGMSSTSSAGTKSMASLAVPIAFTFTIETIADLEDGQVGVTNETYTTEISNFSVSRGIGMMVFDSVLYLLLGFYFERVVKSAYGVSDSCCFCLDVRRWCGGGKRKRRGAGDDEAATTVSAREQNRRASKIEAVTDMDDKKVVSVTSLRKEFPAAHRGAANVVAVDDFNLDMYEGQILALLGHNGAGKTTVINMLTGLMDITKGDALVDELSVLTDMGVIRESMGVCPQHDVLYDLLTVREHLELFAAIKGVARADLDEVVAAAIAQVGLTEKTDVFADSLSGGQKRKLGVAIALLGDSRVVFLDEPTSGMDPYSRRSTWEMLKLAKRGRVIVLTTHFMDEADQLGDRIAIMAKGHIQCVGSSLFLKSAYGIGYTLNITRASGDNAQANITDDAIEKFVLEQTHGGEVLTDVAGEITFRLPFSASEHFADLFMSMDTDETKRQYGIDSYGISVTTLEEVFLRVGDEVAAEEVEDEKAEVELKRIAGDVDGASADAAEIEKKVKAAALVRSGSNKEAFLGKTLTDEDQSFGRHFQALLKKRYQNMLRDRQGLLWQIVYPVVLMIAGIAFVKFGGVNDPISRSMTIGQYNSPMPMPVSTAASTRAPMTSLDVAGGTALPIVDTGVSLATSVPDVSERSLYDSVNENVLLPSVARTETSTVDLAKSPISYRHAYNPYVSAWTYSGNSTIMQRNMSEYLLDNWLATPESKYGAYLLQSIADSNTVQTDAASMLHATTIFFNTTSRHGAPTFLSLYNQARGRAALGDDSFTIKATTYPFPLTAGQSSLRSTLVAIIVSIAFSFIPASFCAFVVMERQIASKHQQLISGVSVFAYWLSALAWDMCVFCVAAVMMWIIVAAYDITQLLDDNFAPWVVCTLLYGSSIITFTYMVSFLFSKAATAQNTLLAVYVFTGVMLLVASIVMSIFESTRDVNEVLIWFYRLLPNFAFSDATVGLMVRDSNVVYGGDISAWDLDVCGYDIIFMVLESFVYFGMVMFIERVKVNGGIRPFLAKITNGRVAAMKTPPPTGGLFVGASGGVAGAARGGASATVHAAENDQLDIDVQAEHNRVDRGEADNDMIVCRHLRLVYPARTSGKGVCSCCCAKAPPKSGPGGGVVDPAVETEALLRMQPKVAVRDLTFGIPGGECFGFLGVNGAGKTSALKMLSADLVATAGTATLQGLDINTERERVRHIIGYCPQFDALLPNLTGRETLTFYASLKGVPADNVTHYVTALLERLGLSQYADRPCGGYSGGNKRKLSLGVALIGNPPIVFLDEPSTGMDPKARRDMWKLISSTMAGRSVILTTHSMEECEALCSRIAVMVSGQLRCLGSSHHLKERYGAGYQVELNAEHDAHAGIEKWMVATFPAANASGKDKKRSQSGGGAAAGSDEGAVLIERQRSGLKFRLGRHESIGAIFAKIERQKEALGIIEYSVSETSLEMIFVGFAKEQSEERGAVAGFSSLTATSGDNADATVVNVANVDAMDVEPDSVVRSDQPSSSGGSVASASGAVVEVDLS